MHQLYHNKCSMKESLLNLKGQTTQQVFLLSNC